MPTSTRPLKSAKARKRPSALQRRAFQAFEIHHRVKNNLQVIASILRLQLRRESSAAAQDALNGAVNRILGMAVVHDLLAHEDGRRVHLRELLQHLLDLTIESFSLPGQAIRASVEGREVALNVDLAIPLAVAANELIINTMKHAFRGRETGAVRAILQKNGDWVELSIADDGHGLPPAFLLYDQTHLGLRIVRGIIQDDLKGQFAIEGGHGTTATIRVSLPARRRT